MSKINKGCHQNKFSEKLGLLAQQGGGRGLTEAQVFVEIFQNQICLGKWLKIRIPLLRCLTNVC